MSTLLEQLYSKNVWQADGSQTTWNFTFAGPVSPSLTYLSRDHVLAYYEDGSGNRHDYVFQDADWLGDYQLNVVPAPPAGLKFVIYRQTPRIRPIADYADGAAVSEPSLDTNSRQAVYLAQEALDSLGLNDDLGFKALKHVPYIGSSTVSILDNGRSHYKTDGTAVAVPNTLPVEYLTTIINNSDSDMAVTFPSGVAYRQGIRDTGITSCTLPARNAMGLTVVSAGDYFINGFIV